ncbi:hypothetical protein B296_00044586 [Ensete ventricosum]|uniref:Uncharacterized protein n=1 Tax=Ensete ventricosum TaxID=4639 RepID=A0A426XKN3_ENSVE|nr:hypothetical protein B296_00044586 [Ensete ventricosum]
MIDNKVTLSTSELDGFDKVEIVTVDYDRSQNPASTNVSKDSDGRLVTGKPKGDSSSISSTSNKNKDDVFSDSDAEDTGSSRGKNANSSNDKTAGIEQGSLDDGAAAAMVAKEAPREGSSGLMSEEAVVTNSAAVSEFKAIAADASVFSFGDEDEYESE